jgi:hypothetical protein
MRTLRNNAFDLIVNRPMVNQIKGFMMSVAFKEG